MESDPQAAEFFDDSVVTCCGVGLGSSQDEEVVDVAACQRSARFELPHWPAVLHQIISAVCTCAAKYMGDSGVNGPEGPAPSHRNATEAVVDDVTRLK